MTFELPTLAYDLDGLEPHISKETLEYHHGKHHQAYVNKLNAAITGTEFADMSLEDIIKKSSGGIFNNAAQIWNHTFYFNGFKPNGGGEPTGAVADAINETFGSFKEFKENSYRVEEDPSSQRNLASEAEEEGRGPSSEGSEKMEIKNWHYQK